MGMTRWAGRPVKPGCGIRNSVNVHNGKKLHDRGRGVFLWVEVPTARAHLPTGYINPGYMPYVQAIVYGLTDLAGSFRSGIAEALSTMNRRGFVDPGDNQTQFQL